MDSGTTERQVVETYLKNYAVEECLDEVINDLVEKRPNNPYTFIIAGLEAKTLPEVLSINLTPVIVCGSTGGVKATISTNLSVFYGVAAYESKLQPGDDIFRNFATVLEPLKVAFRDVDPRNYKQVDDAINSVKDVDVPTKLALSIACMRAGARHAGLPLYKFIATATDNLSGIRLPMVSPPVLIRRVNLLQEDDSIKYVYQRISITPTTLTSMDGCLEALAKASYAVKTKFDELGTIKGFLDGCPVIAGYEHMVDVLTIVEATIKDAGVEGNIKIGVDFSASLLMKPVEIDGVTKPSYVLNGSNYDVLTQEQCFETISSLWRQFELIICEDPFHETDIKSFRQLKAKASGTQKESRQNGSGVMPYCTAGIGGDETCALQICVDNPCTDVNFIRSYDGENVFNTIKIKLNKCGSVSKVIEMCKEAKRLNWSVVLGTDDDDIPESSDTFLADLAVGVGASQINGGGFCGGESTAKYNYLLSIFEEDESMPHTFLGSKFRKV